MPDRIKVYPNQANAIGMRHPIDGPLAEGGSEWSYDSFTCRRLTDGSIVREPGTETASDTDPIPAVASAG